MNLNNMIGVWQQDHWSNRGSPRALLAAGVTTTGGASWTTVNGFKTSLCTGGTAATAAGTSVPPIPWVTFGPTGIAYQLSLSFNDVVAAVHDVRLDHALLASRSTNGGLTWSDPVVVRRDTAPTVFNDKQTITADPTTASFVYAIWDGSSSPASERANVPASFRTSAFSGPTWFARSSNAGVSWEPARPIFDPGQNDQTIGNQIVVQPDGALVDISHRVQQRERQEAPRRLRSRPSLDRQGTTWSGPFDIGRLGTIGNFDPETDDPVRTGDIIPDIAVDSSATPARGRLYAVWQDASLNGGQADAVAFSQSLDGGLTWSSAVKVNKTPTGIPDRQPAGVHAVGGRGRGRDGRGHVLRLPQQPSATLRRSGSSLSPDVASVHQSPANSVDGLQLQRRSRACAGPEAGGLLRPAAQGLANAEQRLIFAASWPQPGQRFFRQAG